MLYGLYIFLTLLQLGLLLLGRMPLFDALCITFGSAGTGGFAIKNDSMGSYTIYQQAVTTIFMILFGVNFNVYFLFYMRKPKEAFRCEEARWYLAIIAASTLIITFFIRDSFENLALAFTTPPSRWEPSSLPPASPPWISICGRRFRGRSW